MAERPIFLPIENGSRLVQEVSISFTWHPGMAPSQKKRNVLALHEGGAKSGISPVLEVSTKSDLKVGQRLSAFSLKLPVCGRETTIECAYQGSKVFERGGPFNDIYFKTSREAKGDFRLKESGRLIKFRFEEEDYPLTPMTAFYDWLYLKALYPHSEWLKRLYSCAGFTDIEFNPERSLNCQARSIALFVALSKRGLLDEAFYSFDAFRKLLQSSTI